jgi:hypothetical protein
MKRERRKPTPSEWRRITSGPGRGPVVRRILSQRPEIFEAGLISIRKDSEGSKAVETKEGSC